MKKIFFVLISLFFVNCESSSLSSNYMAFDNVEYVDKFPVTYTLRTATRLDLDVIGVRDFAIYDSLMIIATTNKDGFWSFWSLPNYKSLGCFLLEGNGPDEFLMSPWVNRASLYEEAGSLYAVVYNDTRRCLQRINISETLKNNKLDIETVRDSLSGALFSCVYIDDETCLCREITNDQTQQIRYFFKSNKKEIPTHFEKLNHARVRRGSGDYNLLSSITKCNVKKKMIVEMPIGLNHINLYSFDGTLACTICVGKKVDNLDNLQSIDRWKRLYTYANLRIYPDFFGVLYLGETEKSFQVEREKLPRIQLFDWTGVPLAELQLTHQATSFDFDFNNGCLYTVDYITEEIYKYEIKDILSQILFVSQ